MLGEGRILIFIVIGESSDSLKARRLMKKNLTAIKNVTLVLRDHYVEDAVLFMDGAKIDSFGEMRETKIPEGTKVIDGKGKYLLPGLVDIHTHASEGVWFYDDPIRAAKSSLRHGTTTVLPTLYFDMPKDELLRQIDVVKKAAKPVKVKIKVKR